MNENIEQTVKKPWHKTWWGYGLQIIFWPFSITYYVWKNEEWSQKSRLIILGIFWSLLVISSLVNDDKTVTSDSSSSQSSPVPTQSAQPTPQVSDEEKKQKNQEVVKKFEQDMYATEKAASAAFGEFKEAAADFSTSDKTTFDLYELAKTAKEECKKAQLAYGKMRTPDEVPNDVKEHLREAATNLSTSYYTKGEALDQALAYLEDDKLSALSEYKEKMSLADRFTFSGVAELMKARELVGLPLVEEQK